MIVGLVIGALIGIATLAGCCICIFWMCKNASYDRHAVQPYHNSNSVFGNMLSVFYLSWLLSSCIRNKCSYIGMIINFVFIN